MRRYGTLRKYGIRYHPRVDRGGVRLAGQGSKATVVQAPNIVEAKKIFKRERPNYVISAIHKKG